MKKTLPILLLFLLILFACDSAVVRTTELPENTGYAFFHVIMQGSAKGASFLLYEKGAMRKTAYLSVNNGESVTAFYANPAKTYEIARIECNGAMGPVRGITNIKAQPGKLNYCGTIELTANWRAYSVKKLEGPQDYAKAVEYFMAFNPELSANYEFVDSSR